MTFGVLMPGTYTTFPTQSWVHVYKSTKWLRLRLQPTATMLHWEHLL